LAPEDVVALALTAKLASVTTLILLIFGTPLALWLSRTSARWRPIVEAVVALPLVLPPTVLGFYLLVLLGPQGALGRFWEGLGGERLVFSFPGLVIGSVLYSLPFVIQPLQNAFNAVGRRPVEVAATLGASPLDRFFSVTLPLARPGFLTAATLAFAHTVGEFGVVLMLGGSIPGRTRVMSVAIYEHVEAVEYASAHVLAAGLLAFSFIVLAAVYTFGRRFETPRL
jgi:molybdate transport system permease protein